MIVKLQGGLGNQMFQYAFAKSLESKGFEVLLDASWYNGINSVLKQLKKNNAEIYKNTIRKLEILNFNISLPILYYFNFEEYMLYSKKDIKYSIFHKLYIKLISRKYRNQQTYSNHFIESNNFSHKFNNIKEFSPYSYFEGYFNDIQYFKDIENIIKKDFTLKKPSSINNAKIKDNIINTKNSVFLHIRRGDYLAHNSIHINLGTTYYNNALKIIKQKLSEPYIFIFSNDIKWCKDNFLHYINDDIKKNMKFDFIDGINEILQTCYYG